MMVESADGPLPLPRNADSRLGPGDWSLIQLGKAHDTRRRRTVRLMVESADGPLPLPRNADSRDLETGVGFSWGRRTTPVDAGPSV